MYIVEPHPQAPDVCPYRGVVNEHGYSAGHRQPTNYSARLGFAKQTETKLAQQHLLLVDSLVCGPIPYTTSDVFWCTWGQFPNAMWAVAQNGTVVSALDWYDADAAEAAVKSMIGIPPGPPPAPGPAPGPAPSPSSCTATLQQYCGKEKCQKESCRSCLMSNKGKFRPAGCTASDLQAFCCM